MYSIIIIDDEPLPRMTINSYISQFHPYFSVDGTFSSAETALTYLNNQSVDVIITDICMPDMNGLDFTAYVHTHYPHVKIVIISGYSEFEYARKAISCGVSHYLLKPLNFDELSHILQEICTNLNITNAHLKYTEEDIALFFTDLINNNMDYQDIERRFSLLELEGQPEDYQGTLLYLDLDMNNIHEKWKYEKENISIVLLNGLRMILSDYSIYYLYRIGIRYIFVILSRNDIPDISYASLTEIMFQLVHFDCKVQVIATFDTLYSLSNNSFIRNSCKVVPTSTLPPDNDIIISKAKDYIHRHYAEDVTREDVADAVYLSPVYFGRLFKQKTGLTFIDYLTLVRMQKATELLNTRMKIQDIVTAIGYKSNNRFYINFRQYSGYTPTEYRRTLLKKEDMYEEN